MSRISRNLILSISAAVILLSIYMLVTSESPASLIISSFLLFISAFSWVYACKEAIWPLGEDNETRDPLYIVNESLEAFAKRSELGIPEPMKDLVKRSDGKKSK